MSTERWWSSARSQRRAPQRSPTLSTTALHLTALTGFAIAQPLFSTLGRFPTFLSVHGTTGWRLVLFAVGAIAVPTALLVLVVVVLRTISLRMAAVASAVLVGALVALIVIQPFVERMRMVVFLASFLAVTVVAGAAYARLRVVRRFLTFLSPAPLVFVVIFLGTNPVRSLVAPASNGAAATNRGPGTSAVLITLDEFAQASILKTDGTIDNERFPNFAKLAERSTWFPNATTVSNATPAAIPSILTGTYPRWGRAPPLAITHPNTLFSLLSATHELRINEWVTRLCPVQRCPQRVAAANSAKDLAADSALVYAVSVSPPAVVGRLPSLNYRWSGYFSEQRTVGEQLGRLPAVMRPVAKPVLNYLADDELTSLEVRRIDRFIRSIRRPSQPTLWFIHPAMPHQPWHLLPDGRSYDRQDMLRQGGPWASQSAADQALQRHLLQLAATDELIGRLISRLDDEAMWDDTLLVVAADHGIVFRAGANLRGVKGTEEDILPVPLFVKFPQQRHGVVDDRNAEVIDILPTMTDVLGVEPSWKVDGSSLRKRDPHRTSKRAWQWGVEQPALGSSIDGRLSMARQIDDLFGPGGGTDDLYAFGPHRELLGRRASKVGSVEPRGDAAATVDDPQRYDDVDTRGPVLPARITGWIRAKALPEWVAVAVDGRIAGTGHAWSSGRSWRFEVMLSPRMLDDGRNRIDVFAIARDGGLTHIPVRRD